MRGVPRNQRDTGLRHGGTESVPLCVARDDRGRNAPQHERESGPLDLESAGDQAGGGHAGRPPPAATNERARRLLGVAQMSEPARQLPTTTTLDDDTVARDAARLDNLWRDRSGVWGWLTAVDHKGI